MSRANSGHQKYRTVSNQASTRFIAVAVSFPVRRTAERNRGVFGSAEVRELAREHTVAASLILGGRYVISCSEIQVLDLI